MNVLPCGQQEVAMLACQRPVNLSMLPRFDGPWLQDQG